MGIFDSLHTGVSGLNAAQIQIQVTGQNITNADSEYYTRQRVHQMAALPTHTTPGDIGMGTMIQSIVRIHDEFSFNKLKTVSGSLEDTTYKKQVLEEIASRFPDLEDNGILRDLKNYFAAWNDFASHPYEATQKENLLNYSDILAKQINTASSKLKEIHLSVNERLKLAIDEVNRLARDIANLNDQIQHVEMSNINHANDLRDKRDHLELTMSKLLNITTFKKDIISDNRLSGNLTDQGKDYSLNIDGISIVDSTTFHPLKFDANNSKDGFGTVYYELNDGRRIDMTKKISSGKISAMLDLRGRNLDDSGFVTDGTISEFRHNLDAFAKKLIIQTNSIYSMSARSNLSSSDLRLLDDKTTLQNFSPEIKTGHFTVKVYDSNANLIASKKININPSTTMNDVKQGNSIVDDFNSDTDDNENNNFNDDVNDFFVASFSFDEKTRTGHFGITPKFDNSQYFISIEDDGTNFAGVLGMNKFFDGDDSSNIRVEHTLMKDSSKIMAGKTPVEGDNSVANAIVDMQNNQFDFVSLNGTKVNTTIIGYYRYITTDISSKTESNNQINDTNETLHQAVNTQFQSISGVNINEELSNIIKFQASYGAAAKIITTIDKMLDTLIGLKQ